MIIFKMKNLHLILFLAIGLFTLSSCEDKDKEEFPKLEFEDLPLPSQQFLTEYFPDNKIVSIGFDKPQQADDTHAADPGIGTGNNLTLYVTLEDDIYVAFSTPNGNWIYVEAGKGLPSSATVILQPHVYQELMAKEPQAKITMLSSLSWHSIGITLDNGHKYAQTQEFAQSGGTILAEVSITNENIKRKFDEFVKRNQIELLAAAGQIFKITEKQGVVYRLFIGNILMISFNENGDWIHGEIDFFADNTAGAATILSRIAENELPESIGEAIRRVGNLGEIRIISSYGNGNYGFHFENKDLLVNEESGVVPSPVGITNKLITDYYETPYTLVHPEGMTVVDVYEYRYSFLYESENDYVNIDMDMYGHWTLIHAFYIDKDRLFNISLPSKMVEATLPDLVIDYLNENYKDEEVYSLIFIRGYGYSVSVNKYAILFTEDGRFRGRVGLPGQPL